MGEFRGDWIQQPAGIGTWLVSSGPGGIQLRDYDRRTVLWRLQEQPLPGVGLSLPVFSADGRFISLPIQESRDRDAIWIIDAVSRERRLGGQVSGAVSH